MLVPCVLKRVPAGGAGLCRARRGLRLQKSLKEAHRKAEQVALLKQARAGGRDCAAARCRCRTATDSAQRSLLCMTSAWGRVHATVVLLRASQELAQLREQVVAAHAASDSRLVSEYSHALHGRARQHSRALSVRRTRTCCHTQPRGAPARRWRPL
jgi:hypothetical protein